MSVRYAEISVIFAVCAAYSAGIPILLPVGAVSFLLFYWVEKALFVNYYLTPPQYSGKLTTEVVRYGPFLKRLTSYSALMVSCLFVYCAWCLARLGTLTVYG